MELQKDFKTPLLNQADQMSTNKMPLSHDMKDLWLVDHQSSIKEEDSNKKNNKLSHLIKDMKDLLPEGFSCLAELKNTINTQKERPITSYEWGWSGPLAKSVSDEVACLAVTFDDKYLIIGDIAGSIKIFELMTKKEVHYFPSNNNGKILSLAVSSDNQYLVGVKTSSIDCYDLKTMQLLFALENSPSDEVCTAVVKDNKSIIFGSKQGSMKIFDISTQSEDHKFDNLHKEAILSIAVSSDGKYVISGSADKSIKILDLNLNKEIHHFDGFHESEVHSVIITDDNKYIISASSSIHIFNLETKQELSYIKNTDEGKINAIALSKSNRYLTATQDNSITVYSFETKEEIYQLKDVHTNTITSLAWLNHNDYILSASLDKKVILFDFENKEKIFSLENPHQKAFFSIKISNKDEFIISTSEDETIRIYDFKKRELYHVIQELAVAVAISPNNDLLAIGSAVDQSIIIFDIKEKKEVHRFPEAHQGIVGTIMFSNDGRSIISAPFGDFNDQTLKIFDIEKRQQVYCFENPGLQTFSLSKDNKFGAVGSDDGSIRLIDFNRKEIIYQFNEVDSGGIYRVAISGDNKYIISCSDANTIKVYSLETKLLVHEFQNVFDGGQPKSVSISHNNKYLVSSCENSIKVWDLESFLELCEYQMTFGTVSEYDSIAISNDNQYIVTGLSDGSIRFFSLETKPEIYDFEASFQMKEEINLFISRNEKCMVLNTESKTYVCDFHKKQILFDLDIKIFTLTVKKILSISNDGEYLGYKTLGNVKIYDMKTRQEIFSIKDLGFKKMEIANNNKSVMLTKPESISVFNIDTQQKKFEIKIDPDLNRNPKKAAVLSNDNKFLIVPANKGDIKLYDLQTSQEIYTFKDAHSNKINLIVNSLDSKYVVSLSEDGQVKMFDIQTKEEVVRFKSSYEKFSQSDLLLSSDNRYIVTKIHNTPTARVFDVYSKKEIQDLPNVGGQLLHFSLDKKQIIAGIMFAAKNELRIYPTLFTSAKFISSKIPAYFTSMNYAAHLLNLDEADSRNQFLMLYNDMYLLPHHWTTLHLLAIFQPSYISQIPKYSEFQVPFLVDKYGKTPLHYLLAHNTVDFTVVNILLEYILDFLDDKKKIKTQYDCQIITDPLSSLFLLIISKTPPRLSYRYLKLCYPNTVPQYGKSLPIFGDSDQKYTFTEIPILNDNISAQIYKEGGDRITFKTNMVKLEYQVDSDDMFMTTNVLSQVEDGQMFKLPIIEKLVDHLWDSTKNVMIFTAIAFSLLMILLSVYTGMGQRSLFMEVSITILTLLFLSAEVLQIAALKNQYLKNVWNLIDLSNLGLILAFMYIRLADNQSVLTESWISSAIIIFGYLRWISYLRLFTATRNLIEIILVVIYDMLGFLTIIASILIGFTLIFLQFSRNQDDTQGYFSQFYKTYQLLFGNYDDSDYSLSQILLTSALMVILNVVLLNLLISIIGGSYGKVQENKELIDASSRLNMIQESIILIRKLARGKASKKKGYLIYCLPATVEDESLESIEWKARMESINNLFQKTENEVKRKVEQEVNQFRNTFDNIEKMEDRMKERINKIEEKLEKEVGQVGDKITKMEDEISQVKKEVQTLGELVLKNFNELNKALNKTS